MQSILKCSIEAVISLNYGCWRSCSEDSELVWIDDCEARHWLKIVILMPAQLNWAGAMLVN